MQSDVIQVYTHTHILFLKFFSFVGYYEVLTIVSCAVQYTFVVCCISIFKLKM